MVAALGGARNNARGRGSAFAELEAHALLDRGGDEPLDGAAEAGYHVAYKGTDGRSKIMRLEAETYEDAVQEVCALLCD